MTTVFDQNGGLHAIQGTISYSKAGSMPTNFSPPNSGTITYIMVDEDGHAVTTDVEGAHAGSPSGIGVRRIVRINEQGDGDNAFTFLDLDNDGKIIDITLKDAYLRCMNNAITNMMTTYPDHTYSSSLQNLPAASGAIIEASLHGMSGLAV